MAFPLFDLPSEAVELVVGFAKEDQETRRSLRLTSKQCRALADLGVTAIQITQDGPGDQLRYLYTAPWQLQSLDITAYVEVDVTALAAANWPTLRNLKLCGALGEDEAWPLTAAPNWPDLQTLDLSGNVYLRIPPTNWPGLRELNLNSTHLGDIGGAALAAASWPFLEGLYLDESGVCDDEIAALAKGNWPSLKNLTLNENEIGVDGVLALANMRCPCLQNLSLEGNIVGYLSGSESTEALARAHWPDLRTLSLAGNCLDSESAEALARAHWPSLRTLSLGYNHLGNEGVVALTGECALAPARAAKPERKRSGRRGGGGAGGRRWQVAWSVLVYPRSQ